MKGILTRSIGSGVGNVRVLDRSEQRSVWPLLEADPITHCFAASRLQPADRESDRYGGQVWVYETRRRIESAVLAGANLVPIRTTAASREAFAQFGIQQGRRCSSMLGPAEEVLDLWAKLSLGWGEARELRDDQPLLAALDSATVPADPAVREVRSSEIDLIFPACVAMFTEEVGVSPLEGGAGPGYRRRISELIATKRSFARFQDGKPIFKAEIGAVSKDACQVQGVWVHPDFRGQGIGSAGMAAVVGFAQQHASLVTLYVNSFNEAALAAYRRAGFRRQGTFATILF